MKTRVNDTSDELLEVFIGMAQVTRCCRQDVAFCEGVTFHQFMILDAVAKRKELPMTNLHEILGVKKSTTTRLVNPLIHKGLLKRNKAINDSRAATLLMTPEGREIYQKVSLCLADFFQKIISNIPDGKKYEVLGAIKILIDAIKNTATECCCCKEGN
ncbi:MAG: MarR family winged helix-turn-helix transcriptional regulator [Smithella sp.]